MLTEVIVLPARPLVHLVRLKLFLLGLVEWTENPKKLSKSSTLVVIALKTAVCAKKN